MIDMVELSWHIIATAMYLCQIGILSVAFSLNFITDKIPNYALGGIIGTGHLISWTVAKTMNYNPYLSLPVAFIVGGILNTLFFIGIIEKSHKFRRNLVYITILTIALEFILSSFNRIWWFSIREKTPTMDFSLFIKSTDQLFFGLPVSLYISITTTLLIFWVLKYKLPRTREGSVFNAVSENPSLASIQGINVTGAKVVVWFLSGGLAGYVGSLFPFVFHSFPSGTMYIVTAGLVGCILGGVENLIHALLGGLLLGGLELGLMYILMYVLGNWIGNYRPVIPLMVLALVLLYAPEGLFKYIRSRKKRSLFN